ncbi:MAG: hypothetical protein ACYSU7_10475 [Planctomycetota bacterium]
MIREGWKAGWCLAVVIVLSLAGTAPGQLLVVSPCGNDAWGGFGSNCSNPNTVLRPKRTIQAAINAMTVQGTIYVMPGTYNERIDFLGRPIWLFSTDGPEFTTIDGTGLNGSVVVCDSGEDWNTRLDGFTITGGTAANGGGMYNSGSSPIVAFCAFTGNTAAEGGGMYNINASPLIVSTTFTNNTANGNTDNHGGGGMSNVAGGVPVLIACWFIENDAGNRGGGMRNGAGCDPVLFSCTFIGNDAVIAGGAMYNYRSAANLINCAFSGNSAAWNGGALCNEAIVSDPTGPTANNCTFTRNEADWGGGLFNFNDAAPTYNNCIFWDNSSNFGGDEVYNDTDAAPTFNSCVVEDSGGSVAWNPVFGTDGGGNIDKDPRFTDSLGPDGIAGTTDDDLTLDAGSSCIDAGDNTLVPTDTEDLDSDGNTSEAVPVDRGGLPRFVDAVNYADTGVPGNGYAQIVDIGAFEAAADTEPGLGDDPHHVGVYRGGDWYLDLNGNDDWDGKDTSFSFGLPTDVPVAGDWDGDGEDEAGIYRAGKWYLDLNGNGGWDGGDDTFRFGLPTDLPVVGDWDGDGTDNVGIVRGGKWYLDMNGNAVWDGPDVSFRFGLATDVPVVGDWNGDDADDIGIRRKKTWYLDLNGNEQWDGGDGTFNFGTPNDIPVVGDWDGDGADNIGVFRSGTWYLDESGNGQWDGGDVSFRFGRSGDVPVPALWYP